MSRHNPGGGYGHATWKIGPDLWLISWKWDRYYASSRIRYPQTITRATDSSGAERFAKRHGLEWKGAPKGPVGG